MNKILSILFLINSLLCLAQENLVPNGSFEEYMECPHSADEINKAIGWYMPAMGTSDYYNPCNHSFFPPPTGVGVPSNVTGYQNAYHGVSYAGFLTYSFAEDDPNYKEYIACKLTQTLDTAKTYQFEMYVSLADNSTFTTSTFGVKFYEDSVFYNHYYNIDEVPDIYFDTLISDTAIWVQLKKIFKPTQKSKYMIIGNFNTDDLSNLTLINESGYNMTYFYIDLISINEYTYEDSISLSEKINIPNVFTPNNDGINDYVDFSMLEGEVYIYNRWGNLVYITNEQSNYLWYGKNNFGEDLSEGVYFYIIESENFKKQGYIHLIR